MDRYRRDTKSDDADQYVLQVFLPLLAVAILACLGGCFYMERRRRRKKKKNGGVDPEELRHKQDIEDTLSVISASSSKRRHYLNPTPTTGRTVRGASVRSSYSPFGATVYEAQNLRRASNASRNGYRLSDEEMDRPSSRRSNGYGGRPLSRARSMTDMRANADGDRRSLQRSRSSNSLGKMSSDMADSGYNDNQSNSETENAYEFLNWKPEKEPNNRPPPFDYNRAPSPSQSAYSIRTASSRTGHDNYRTNGVRSHGSSREITNGEFGSSHDRRLLRSMSQPDLSRLTDYKTYPQGILKKDAVGDTRIQRFTGYQNNYRDGHGDAANGTGYNANNGHYHHHPRPSRAQHSNETPSNARARSRPSSAMSYRAQSYDPYYTRQYGDYSMYGNYGHAPAYRATGYQRHHQLPGKYQQGAYDQYGNYSDYWANYTHNNRMSMY